MAQTLNPPTPAKVDTSDTHRLRSLEQILSPSTGGNFLSEGMEGHKDLQRNLLDHMAEHGSKGCAGAMTIKVSYALGKSGDVAMGAKVTFDNPKGPPSTAAAYVNDDGELTLYSPFMARMHPQPVRDTTDYDPETGEVRDT